MRFDIFQLLSSPDFTSALHPECPLSLSLPFGGRKDKERGSLRVITGLLFALTQTDSIPDAPLPRNKPTLTACHNGRMRAVNSWSFEPAGLPPR
jgi:hypothetical protein